MITSQAYQPQSADTHPEIERFLLQAFREMPAIEKADLIDKATKGIQQWALIGIRHQYPDATPAEMRFQLAVRWSCPETPTLSLACPAVTWVGALGHELGKEIADRVYRDPERKIMDAESIGLALRMAEILESIGIAYLIGGSVASSIWGEPRATLDVDLVADLQLKQVQSLIAATIEEFYIDEMMVTAAIAGKSSFNIIHLDSMQKVDIFLLDKQQPLAESEMQRRQLAGGFNPRLEIAPDRAIWLASAEDIILQKLILDRMGNMSDRHDILGVPKVQGESLDFDYLANWAKMLQLEEMMTQALRSSGLGE